jgi:hypothetical protein
LRAALSWVETQSGGWVETYLVTLSAWSTRWSRASVTHRYYP